MSLKKLIAAATVGCGIIAGASSAAVAGDYAGDFMVRVQGTYLLTDDDRKSINSANLGNITALADTKTTNSVLPTATLTYFFTKNIAAELFCCFATSTVKIEGAANGLVADTWMFPPALTLQYHFDGMGAFKPYVGVGAQWIHFFDEDAKGNVLGATKVEIDDAFGIVLQAGVDIEMGRGWYLNADVKKSFLDTTVTAYNATALGLGTTRVEHDLDPWVFSVGIGYRFNMFGSRAEPLK